MAPTPANPTPASPSPIQVHPSRVRVLHPGGGRETAGPVVYWMLRDQRLADNWALLHAACLAAAAVPSAPVAVAFSLFPRPFLLGARRRQLGFLLRGLRRLAADARAGGLPFFFLEGGPAEVPALVRRLGASALVADFSPLRPVRESLDAVVGELRRDAPAVAVHQVDAHNVVPVWAASGKLEYSAKTLRGKVNKVIDEYLVEFPEMPTTAQWNMEQPEDVDWEALIDRVFSEAENVPEINWCEPGEAAAMEVLLGSKDGFLTKRIKSYESDRNDPTKPRALSCLSPYLHFGHISAQRCALEAKRHRHLSPKSVDAFLEELIIRRELADNFCHYQPHYDSLAGAWEWARKTLMEHAADRREQIYTREQLENAKTSDHLWNASQLEMVHHGKMHGFMRSNSVRSMGAHLANLGRLVAHDRCWTADRLAHRGLEHPEKCVLCDQEQETINHLLIACPFARQYWYMSLAQVGLQRLAPQPTDTIFDEWWEKVWQAAPEQQKMGLNSMVELGAWIIWTHRNGCVFEGLAPSMSQALMVSNDERCLWEMAGARGLSLLLADIGV